MKHQVAAVQQYSVVKHQGGFILSYDGYYYPCKDVFALWLRIKTLGLK